GFLGAREKNFWNFSLRALAGFTKSAATTHERARNRHRKRYLVWNFAQTDHKLGRTMPRSARRSLRGHNRHAIAGRKHRTARRTPVSILSATVFSAQQTYARRRARPNV